MKPLNNFLNEGETYRDYISAMNKVFKKTGIDKHCYDNRMQTSGSGFEIPNPNGSFGITFWLLDDDVDIKELQKVAKDFAKKHGFIAATFYPEGIVSNADSTKTQDWSNKAAQNSDFVYGFTFYSKNNSFGNIYTVLK